jgi:hypothetical protein
MEGYMTNKTPTPETDAERREFLRRAGKFAAVTPPAVTLMLAATSVPANAKGSGGGGGSGANNGLGNGDQTAPGNSLPHNGAENNTGNTTGSGNPPGSGKFPVVPN